VIVAIDLAARRADPDPRVPAVAACGEIGRLLHADHAGQRVAGTAETEHHAVAGALDLDSLAFRSGEAQRAEMRPAHRLIGVMSEAVGKLGRPDEVGEDDGGGLGSNHRSDELLTKVVVRLFPGIPILRGHPSRRAS